MRSASPASADVGAPGQGMLGAALQRYFCRYLIDQRHLSPQTVASYRDTFRLLLAFIERVFRLKPDELRVADITSSRVLAFLDDLERTRGNSVRTRNVRLAPIRSFLRYAAGADPLLLPVAQKVLAIPSKRFERGRVGHLSRAQMQLLLDTPDRSTRAGTRDGVLLTLMYNTGARVSEIAALKFGDLRLDTGGSLHVHGKGRKQRTVPLWRDTVRLLRAWSRHTPHNDEAPLLPNARGEHMTRSGIEQRLRVVLDRAALRDPSLRKLRVSPHTIRHTTAMHLLQSGIDLSVIAMWLGHESIETTHQYLNADLETKRRALAHLKSPAVHRLAPQSPPSLTVFLKSL
jgi:integrase/recombinase XerD